MTKTERRRAQLDALKILKLTNKGTSLEDATRLAVPMVQSKATSYTRTRRRRARIEAQKAMRARMYAEDYAKEIKLKPKKPRKRLSDLQKRENRARKMTGGRLTARQKEALKKGYSARQAVRGRTPEGSKQWRARVSRLKNAYDLTGSSLTDSEIKSLSEYMTAKEIAKRYNLPQLDTSKRLKPASEWWTLLDTKKQDTDIDYETLKKAFGDYISSHELEQPQVEGHNRGFFIYDNGLHTGETITLATLDEPGDFKSIEDACVIICEKVFGPDYIFIMFETKPGGIVIKASQWATVGELAPDWEDTLHYKPISAIELPGLDGDVSDEFPED